jgi:hypothetical protein
MRSEHSVVRILSEVRFAARPLGSFHQFNRGFITTMQCNSAFGTPITIPSQGKPADGNSNGN